MEFIEYLKHIQAVVYSAFINFFIAVTLYILLCRIPLTKTETLITFGLWFVYFGFVYIFYCLISLVLSGIRKVFLSIIAILIAMVVICTFYFMVTGFIFQDQQMVTSFILILLLSADIPFLVSFLQKKL